MTPGACPWHSRFSDAVSPVWHADPQLEFEKVKVHSVKWEPIIPGKDPKSTKLAICNFHISTGTARVNFGIGEELFV